MNRIHRLSRLGSVKNITQVSQLRILLVFCALTPYTMAAPVQQADEKPGQPQRVQSPHQHHQATVPDPAGEKANAQPAQAYISMTIPDLEVKDQNGNKLHFYTDLVKGKVVVINFIYTDCTYVCPMQGTSFSRLQSALGERLGKDVSLISVSTDPVTDTPERLKAWSEKFGAKQGWKLVTGEKIPMDKLLLALSGDAARKGVHSAIALIGSEAKGLWVRTYGLEEPQRMIEMIDRILNLPTAEAVHH